MNIEAILAVADAIEADARPELQFDMACWGNEVRHNCRTPACIAGYAAFPLGGGSVVHRAEDVLDLATDTAQRLFLASDSRRYLEEITPAQAVAVLRHLAATGEVNWARFDYLSPRDEEADPPGEPPYEPDQRYPE